MNNGEGLKKAIIELEEKLKGRPDYSEIERSMTNLRKSADYVTVRLAQVPMLEGPLAKKEAELEELRRQNRKLKDILEKHGIGTENDQPTNPGRFYRLIRAFLPAKGGP